MISQMTDQMMSRMDYQCKMISQMTDQMMSRMDYQCKMISQMTEQMMSRMTDQLEMISEKMQNSARKLKLQNMNWGTPKQSQKWIGTLTSQTQINK